MISGLLSNTISVYRRIPQGRDSLNAPYYGPSRSLLPGPDYTSVYVNIKCRLAFGGKDVGFTAIGERIEPSGTVYVDGKYDIRNMDRIITKDGVMYTVIGVINAEMPSGLVAHKEIKVVLP